MTLEGRRRRRGKGCEPVSAGPLSSDWLSLRQLLASLANNSPDGLGEGLVYRSNTLLCCLFRSLVICNLSSYIQPLPLPHSPIALALSLALYFHSQRWRTLI
jgi:hypothetical protein